MPIVSRPERHKVLCWGAGCGKTRVCLYTQAAYVLSGPPGPSAWVTRDGKFARDEFRKAGKLLPKELVEESSRMDLCYRLRGGAEWWFYSGLEPGAFRGKQWRSAVFNEASYCVAEGWTEAIAPRLVDWAVFNFTPRGLRNWTFGDLWQRATGPSWWRSQLPTTANPTITPERIDEFRQVVSDAQYRQEILAEFVSDFGRYFNPAPAFWGGAFEPYDKAARYAAGIDWAKYQDYTAWAIMRTDTLPRRLVHFGRLPHIDYTAQVPLLVKELKAYGNPPAFADASEETANELMKAAGCNVERFPFTAQSKQHLCDQLRVAVEKADLIAPATPERLGQLRGEGNVISPRADRRTSEQERAARLLADEFEYFEPYLRSGRVVLGARGEHHDDLLAAAMLALEAARRGIGAVPEVYVVTAGRGGRKF